MIEMGANQLGYWEEMLAGCRKGPRQRLPERNEVGNTVRRPRQTKTVSRSL
jgi:hypothetical protein